MTTKPAGLERSDPKAYQKMQCERVGDRDPIELLVATPATLQRIVSQHSPKVMRTRPFPGKWTPNEIIGHLGDTEWTYGFRIRMILSEDSPAILGMDQEKWVIGQGHNDREPSELLEIFRELRRFNLLLWKRMNPAALERTGRHNERGPESLGLMLRMTAGHDLSHIDQITRYLAAIASA